MSIALRRLRGAIGIGVVFSVLWVLTGELIVSVIGFLRPDNIGPGEGPLDILPIFALLGFLCGLGFSAMVMLTERKTSFDKLSVLRMALWGAIGSALIPILMGANPNMWLITAPLGALFASTSVAIARRSQLPAAKQQELIE